VIELRGVRHRYGERVVLDLPQFTVDRGALVGVVGHNGAGKSTLLRLLAALESPTEGEVRLDGRPVAGAERAARRRVTLVEQRPLLLRGTVRDNLGYGLRARGVPRAEAGRLIGDVAERIGVTPLLDRRRRELSDGEVQRVAVARALAVRPDVLLLDEPASSADRASAATLYEALASERAARGLTVCLASHQLEDAYRWADDIRALADGRLSPVTPENLFRVTLPAAGTGGVKHVRVGQAQLAVMTDRAGPAILAVPPTDVFVSTAPVASSARNVLAGRVTRVAAAHANAGGVQVTADVGVEMVALVTAAAVAELGLVPGKAVVFAFKATAVKVF
jgi:tungstate transport system ATP-binding protein